MPGAQANFPLRAVFDLSDSLSQRGLAFEPGLVLARNTSSGWQLERQRRCWCQATASSPTPSTAWRPPFATAARPAYEAKSGLIAFRLGATASRPITPDWNFFTFARVDTVAGAANDNSPLVRQKTGATVGVGVSYTFLRSERRAVD